jgi:putative protease
MQLLVNPASYSNALELIDLNVHQIFIGDSQFSVRNNCCLKLKEIKSLCDLKKETKILILINRFFFDHELEQLENYILEISKLKIDGIIFSDFAVNQICYEHKIKIPLIYCSETLVTNHEQFPFYFDNNIQEVSLARELNRNEIKEICKHKNQMKLQMQADGHVYVMHSR